jgi:hypothetical protein
MTQKTPDRYDRLNQLLTVESFWWLYHLVSSATRRWLRLRTSEPNDGKPRNRRVKTIHMNQILQTDTPQSQSDESHQMQD